MTMTIRLVFVDNRGLSRNELSEQIAALTGMKVLASVGKPDQAAANDPDLEIVDLRLKKADGLGLLCQLQAADPASAAFMAADSYEDDSRDSDVSPLWQLTEREWQILECVTRGMTNKTIAKALAISHETVKLHVRHILAKLKVVSRVEAAVLAVELQMSHCTSAGTRHAARTAVRAMAQGA